MKPTLLLVEEPGAVRELQVLALESQGWRVVALSDLGAAAGALESRPALLLVAAGLLTVGALGVEALRGALARWPAPLHLLAFPAEADAVRPLGLPVAGVLERPSSLGGLVEGVRQVLPAEAREPPGTRPLTVLVADDDPVSRKLLQLHLLPLRFQVVTASDGESALEVARRRRPDAVVADAMMPRQDGYRLCLALRQDPRLARVPVVLTQSVTPDELDWRMAHNVGANGFVRRTQEGDELVGTLLRALRAGGPAPLVPPGEEPSTEEHLFRTVRQLERRVGLLEQAERGARESEERFRLVVNGSYDGIWDWDLRRGTLYWSPRLLEMLGLMPDTFPGTYDAFIERVHPEDRREVLSAMSAHLERGAPYDVSLRLLHATGGYRSCVSRGRALRDEQGRPVRMAGIIGDVTEQLRLYRETREAVRARDDFLTMAAHELRTPLAALRLRVQGAQGVLRAVGLAQAPQRLERALEAADRQVQRLADLVESLLDVSQFQGGPPRLHLEQVDLAKVVRDAVTRSEAAAARAGCQLVLRSLVSTPGRWDSARMGQVVSHLLSNAMKFGPGKPVEVGLEHEPAGATLVVRDHGIGIAPGRLDGIFHRFERAVPVRHYGGLGLGLYRLRRIVEAHGGEVHVDSVPGDGATFRVRLPLDGPPVVWA
ncbi:PAS domain-containing protein [Myxococcus sp. K15C18031901]|uniref:sensor histidine kinase n=1 Tax=Myxococcus dinghuensis TaxID=2906761 RepID=UPI0020A76F53|nr:ATP-binding protein [Myxococcus dinghuensis]MCP3104789.1 PAS domain-containing protein [Myxococcus dinghuensis]